MTEPSGTFEPLVFKHDRVHTGDLTIHVASVEGNGPAMVLLHGMGMDWRVWQAVSRRLRRRFSPLLIDLRGHGTSDKPAHGYTPSHYAADVEDVIDRLGLRGAVLVGSSLGGVVAGAVEAPRDVVSHRVLVDPPLTGGPVRDKTMFREILRLKHEPADELADYLRNTNPSLGRHLLRAMSEMWHAAADGVIEDMLSCPDDFYDIDASLRSIDSPTLLLRAEADRGGVLTAEQADRSCRLLQAGSSVLVEGAGHAIHATKPVQFVDLVESFVSNA